MLNNFQLSASLVILQNNFQTAFTAHKVSRKAGARRRAVGSGQRGVVEGSHKAWPGH